MNITDSSSARDDVERGSAVEQHIADISSLSDAMLRGVDAALEQITEVNRATHLLSVNARIEAALANEAGVGFAVVATEMKRLSSEVESITQQLRTQAQRTGSQMRDAVSGYVTQVRDARLCELALVNIDLIDRNLYERSCDVRWWATDAAAVACTLDPSSSACAHASKRLGQILDSYTVYMDLVLVDCEGRVLANGRPAQFTSEGMDVSDSPWFQQAMATHDGSEFGFFTVHESELVCGKRVLAYSCAVREGGKILGVLGILFDWDALALTIVRCTPLTAAEWTRTRVCIVDDQGLVLADSQSDGNSRLEVGGWKSLFEQPRGSLVTKMGGRDVCVAHAASPGYETYRTGWHSLILQSIDG
ncbi:methyl-accepting chemotaxis protein [Billgrantia endophytica]|uniref:Chemotaxis protein n=1 Tax=Billgrantia endophytica TaxID=2033802 RepID=A0A2N7TZX9_9GAMM|nr:methyl-accepting chemotaxis protein [Halomonas endophytica]PMR73746.1 chemotaxis protein [Halomonas endophytica]